MKSYGFIVYDPCGQARREMDNAFLQTDLIFVREENPLRTHKKFWEHLPDDDQSIKEGVD